MSVRERILFHTGLAPSELAQRIAPAVGARLQVHPAMVEVLLPLATVVDGFDGEFGGPVVRREPEWPYREPGEWEATDAYDIEWRLWQAYGPRVDPSDGRDLELTAASLVFERLAGVMTVGMLHVHLADRLVAAFHPQHGLHRFAPDTTVYDWDEDTWGPWVSPSPAKTSR